MESGAISIEQLITDGNLVDSLFSVLTEPARSGSVAKNLSRQNRPQESSNRSVFWNKGRSFCSFCSDTIFNFKYTLLDELKNFCNTTWASAVLQKHEEEHKERSFTVLLLCLDGHSEQFCNECIAQSHRQSGKAATSCLLSFIRSQAYLFRKLFSSPSRFLFQEMLHTRVKHDGQVSSPDVFFCGLTF